MSIKILYGTQTQTAKEFSTRLGRWLWRYEVNYEIICLSHYEQV